MFKGTNEQLLNALSEVGDRGGTKGHVANAAIDYIGELEDALKLADELASLALKCKGKHHGLLSIDHDNISEMIRTANEYREART